MVINKNIPGLKFSFFFRSIFNHKNESENWIERHNNESKNITQFSMIGTEVRYFLSIELGEVFLEYSTSKKSLAQEQMNEGLDTWKPPEPVPSSRYFESCRLKPLMDISLTGQTPSSTSGSQAGVGTSRLKELQKRL